VPFPSETPVRGELRLDGVAPGPLYGFVGWFTLHLAPGVDLGTGPADPLTHWKQQLLPVEPFYVDGPLLLTAEVGPAAGDRRGAEVLLRWSSLLGEGQSFHRVR
jgi:hypothetical protein